MSGGPKFTVVLSTICYSALHITVTGSLADTVMNTPVRDWANLLKLIQILKRRCKMELPHGHCFAGSTLLGFNTFEFNKF